MRPGSEGGEPGRRREAGPVGADALDVAQEPGELDGKGSPKVGVDGPGTMCDGHGLTNEAGGSRYLWAEGCIHPRSSPVSFTCEVTGGDARKLFRNWRAWVHAMRG